MGTELNGPYKGHHGKEKQDTRQVSGIEGLFEPDGHIFSDSEFFRDLDVGIGSVWDIVMVVVGVYRVAAVGDVVGRSVCSQQGDRFHI